MKTINLSGLDMKKFIGTGYNPGQDIVNIDGRDDGRDDGRTEHERIKSSQKQIVEEPKERPEVYY